MVNTGKRLPPSRPHPTDAERKIADGPCHDLTIVHALIRAKGYKGIHVATEDGSGEMIDYCMDEQDLADLVMSLSQRHYNGSEWCKFSPDSPWFEADSYRIRKAEKLPSERDVRQCSYYLKFSINKLGSMILFFSVHRDKL